MSDSPTSGDAYSDIKITPDPGFKLTFDNLKGTEELGRPFEYNLVLSSDTSKPDLTALLGSSATLTMAMVDGSKRYFNGIVARAVYGGLAGAGYRYHLELRPWIWLLSRTQNCQIFQNMSVWDIITKVFRDAGFTNFSDKRQNQAGDQTLEYCVQYNETALAFVTRLMEKYGLYYFVTHDETQHTLVMADDPNSHTALAKSIAFNFRQTDYRSVQEHIWEWNADLRLQPGATTFRDYNFTTPSADLTAKSLHSGSTSYGSFEVYEYPGPYGVTADGQKISDVRMQRFSSQHQVLRGITNARGMIVGCKFSMTDFSDDSQNREYLVIAAEYQVDEAESVAQTGGELTEAFKCNFYAIPGDTAFRLDEKTPWPKMYGPQTAKVVGASGDEVTTDQYGRIKVKFPWDRSTVQDENASCWIRVAQLWAGTSWGGIYIPRVGQEVVVDYLNGNPDRPIIVGCVYNATTTVPYPLPDNKTRSTIKTNSSTGGGGFNEFRFEDKKGSEEVFFQAQKDYNKVVLNNETVKITQDTTTTVDKGNRSITVSQGNNSVTVSQGDHSMTVSTGNHSVTVSKGNDSMTVSAGNHSITVSAGTSAISAGQSITLSVGANSLKIDNTGVTVSGTKIALTAQAELTANGGGMMSLQAGEISIN